MLSKWHDHCDAAPVCTVHLLLLWCGMETSSSPLAEDDCVCVCHLQTTTYYVTLRKFCCICKQVPGKVASAGRAEWQHIGCCQKLAHKFRNLKLQSWTWIVLHIPYKYNNDIMNLHTCILVNYINFWLNQNLSKPLSEGYPNFCMLNLNI